MIKATKRIEKLMEELSQVLPMLQDLADKRDDHYSDRSDNWQESDKGMEWEEDTDNLNATICSLEELIENLDNTFEI